MLLCRVLRKNLTEAAHSWYNNSKEGDIKMTDSSGSTPHKPDLKTVQDTMRRISAQDFLNFGKQQVAYVRPLKSEDGSEKEKSFMIYAADGTPLSAMESLESAMVVIRHNDLEPVTLQ